MSNDLNPYKITFPHDWPSLDFIEKINPGSKDAHYYSINYSYLCYVALYQFAAAFCKGHKVLDAASGLGFGSYLLSQTATDVTGFEIVGEDVDFATRSYKKNNLAFIHGDATATNFAENFFSRIVSLETFEHIPPEKAVIFLNELYRVLQPGGLLIFSTPNRDVYSQISQTPDHVNELNVEKMKAILENVFPTITPYYQRKGVLQTTGKYYSAVKKDKLGIRKMAPNWLKRLIRKMAAPGLEKSTGEILKEVQVKKAEMLDEVKESVIQIWVCRK